MYQNPYLNNYGYNQFYNQPLQMPQYNNQSMIQQNQSPTLLGKIVDSIDVVRGIDIPIGQSGIYPKADGKSVYIKYWKNDGTTQIDEYEKIIINKVEDINSVTLNDIYDVVQNINKMVNKSSSSSSPTTGAKRKKVDEDE